MTIYIDIVLLENIIMNYIILLATGIVLKEEIKQKRILIASIIRGNLFSNNIYNKIKNIFKCYYKNNTINNNSLYSI